MECLVLPLQDKLDDWRKGAAQLDKDHSKEYKKLRAEVRRRGDQHSRMAKKHAKSSKKNQAETKKQADQAQLELSKQYKQLVSEQSITK